MDRWKLSLALVLFLGVIAFILIAPRPALAYPTSTIWGIPDGWTNSDVTFSMTTDEDNDPRTHKYYSIGDGPQQEFTSGFVTVSSEGSTLIHYHSYLKCCPVIPPEEPERTVIVYIDKTAPSTLISGLPSGWTPPGSYSFSLLGSDSHSGIKEIRYRINNGPSSVYTGSPVQVNADHTTSIDYWSVDKAGNAEEPKTATILVETGEPATTISGVPTGWSASSVSLMMSATAPYLPVSSTSYRIGNGPTQTYTAPVVVSGEGVTTVTYYSTDTGGGSETPKSATVMIDKTAPQTTMTGVPSTSVWAPVDMNLSATDSGSGVATMHYSVGGGASIVTTGPVVVNGIGETYVSYWSVDEAGNVETPHLEVLNLNRVKTSLTISSSRFRVWAGRYGAPILSGVVKPTIGLVGTVMHVNVKKPWRATWTYSSNRVIYYSPSDEQSHWWYRYVFYSRMGHGYYYYRAFFDGNENHLPSSTGAIRVRY